MDELPPIKLPKDYTGQGIEIIGDPDDLFSECVSLFFQDGSFVSIGLPTRSLVLSADPNQPPERQTPERQASIRRYYAKALAETFQKDPSDINAKQSLKAIRKACRQAKTRERGTENAIRKIMAGDFNANWSFQNCRERLAIRAVMELARELSKPPTEAEVIDRMKVFTDAENIKLIQDGERKHLAELLRASGFGWLERRGRGYRGAR
jgi:hypothetical protein